MTVMQASIKCGNPVCDNDGDFLHLSYIEYDRKVQIDVEINKNRRKQIDLWVCKKCRTINRIESEMN
jgi:hypothetical protein